MADDGKRDEPGSKARATAEERRGAPRPREGEHRRHESRWRDLARRVLLERERLRDREPFRERVREPEPAEENERERDGHIPFEVARDAVAALLETGDRAKNEAVRLAAREIRHYLTELRLGEEMHNLLRDYKLEVHATFNLSPLSGADDSEQAGAGSEDDTSSSEES